MARSIIGVVNDPARRGPTPVVRLIIPDGQGRVLLLKRAGSSAAPGAWCLPGGKIEYGQTMEEAVRAELREETGMDCAESIFLFWQDSLPLEPGGMHCINLYFEVTAEGQLRTTPEAAEFAWVGPDDLSKFTIAFRHDEGLRRYWSEKQLGKLKPSDSG